MTLIDTLSDLGCYLTQAQMDSVIDMLLATDEFDDDDDKRVCALASHLGGVAVSDIDKVKWDCYGIPVFSVGNAEYAVATDDEADNAWELALDNYIDVCIKPGLPDQMSAYFDEESWKHDARYDGRGAQLSSYDGEEQEVNEFFIYRMN